MVLIKVFSSLGRGQTLLDLASGNDGLTWLKSMVSGRTLLDSTSGDEGLTWSLLTGLALMFEWKYMQL